jgi:hypothetical protein
VIRAEIVKEWLESLTGVPSIEAKVALGQAEGGKEEFTDLRAMLEPYAVKVARTVLRRGKREISYLFRPPDSANTSVDV